MILFDGRVYCFVYFLLSCFLILITYEQYFVMILFSKLLIIRIC